MIWKIGVDMTDYIYALKDPNTKEIRYIGKTIRPMVRLKQHVDEAKNRKIISHKTNWIYGLLTNGQEPIMEILKESDDWQKDEKELIAKHRSSGRLLNIADGGEGPGEVPKTPYMCLIRKFSHLLFDAMRENNFRREKLYRNIIEKLKSERKHFLDRGFAREDYDAWLKFLFKDSYMLTKVLNGEQT